MARYHQKITRFLGHAQKLGVPFEPRSFFMLTWSAQLLLGAGKEISIIPNPRSEQKLRRILAAVRELLDEVDRALDEMLMVHPPRTLQLHAPRLQALMQASPES